MKSTSVLSHPPSPRQILSFPVSADEPVRQKLRCLKHALPHRTDEISALVYECVCVCLSMLVREKEALRDL